MEALRRGPAVGQRAAELEQRPRELDAALQGVARELFLELAPPELELRQMRVEAKVAVRTSREVAYGIEARVVNAGYLVKHAVDPERLCTIAMTVEQVPGSESNAKESE